MRGAPRARPRRGRQRAVRLGSDRGDPFASTVADARAWAFNCAFELRPGLTELAAYDKEGILVHVYNTFGDDSGRADYWTREFFHREDAE